MEKAKPNTTVTISTFIKLTVPLLEGDTAIEPTDTTYMYELLSKMSPMDRHTVLKYGFRMMKKQHNSLLSPSVRSQLEEANAYALIRLKIWTVKVLSGSIIAVLTIGIVGPIVYGMRQDIISAGGLWSYLRSFFGV